MATHEQLRSYEAASNAPSANAFDKLASIAKWIVDWMNACADARASAALYDELSRLSDAELRTRGLTREMLARYAFNLPHTITQR